MCIDLNRRKEYFKDVRIQERALRAVVLYKQSSYRGLLNKSNLMTPQNGTLQDIAFLMYKVKHRLCPTKICKLFHIDYSANNLRLSEFAIPKFTTKKYGKHLFAYMGPSKL